MFDRKDNFWLYLVGLLLVFVIAFAVIQSSRGKGIFDFGTTTSKPRATVIVTPRLTVSPTAKSKITPSITPTTNPKITKKVTPTVKPTIKKPTPTKQTGKTLDLSKDYTATVKTSEGDFVIDLFEKNAPNTVANFITLANNNYYDKKLFLKLAPNSAIQLGDKDLQSNAGYMIPDETNWDSLDFSEALRLSLTTSGFASARKIQSKPLIKYSVATANPAPNSSSSQFIISLNESSDSIIRSLRGKSTVFGQVTSGFDVIEKINKYSPKDITKVSITDVVVQVKQ